MGELIIGIVITGIIVAVFVIKNSKGDDTPKDNTGTGGGGGYQTGGEIKDSDFNEKLD